jgi:hypothetical protein
MEEQYRQLTRDIMLHLPIKPDVLKRARDWSQATFGAKCSLWPATDRLRFAPYAVLQGCLDHRRRWRCAQKTSCGRTASRSARTAGQFTSSLR